MSLPLTVLIPCKDEMLNIRPCIESARLVADEVLVADSGSTDRTLEIVRSMGGCRIIQREYVNSANFKNWAIPQAKHSWVMVLDADERVTPELAAEVKQLLASEPACDGYHIQRNNYFFGHAVRYGIGRKDAPLRLFRRDYRYQERRVHADVIVPTGNIGKLKARFDHFTVWNVENYLKTHDRYTTWAAQDRYHAGKRSTVIGTVMRPPLKFFQNYVLYRGFLDGWVGLQMAVLTACYVAVREAKLWQYEHGLAQPNPEAEQADEPRVLSLETVIANRAAQTSTANTTRTSKAA